MAQHILRLAFIHRSNGIVSPAPCHSALSAVISPGEGPSSRVQAPSECSESSQPKEHDYIGLSEVSSSSSSPSSPSISSPNQISEQIAIRETDLHLGLGLGFARNPDPPKPMPFASLQQDMRCASPPEKVNEALPSSKRGVKRLFSEAMMDARGDAKSPNQGFLGTVPKDQHNAFRGTATCAGGPAFGRVGVDQFMASHGNTVNFGCTIAADASAPPWNSTLKESSTYYMYSSQDEGLAGPPPAKAQVVGWPPVPSYRKNILSAQAREFAGDEEEGQSAIFVKVNMDGNPIGRKVDLNAIGSYEGLVSALEEMFQSPANGMHFLRNSESVLTYEDQEGDWMLVGDVPWSMFINTVKRLRILRGCDAGVAGTCSSAVVGWAGCKGAFFLNGFVMQFGGLNYFSIATAPRLTKFRA